VTLRMSGLVESRARRVPGQGGCGLLNADNERPVYLCWGNRRFWGADTDPSALL
jgi:hypothetical protein